MPEKGTRPMLARLVDLRRYREDRARKELAAGLAMLASAQTEHAEEARLRDQMDAALPKRYALHLHYALQLCEPEESLELFLGGLADDRNRLVEQEMATENALHICTNAIIAVQALQLRFRQLLRQRDATETLQQFHITDDLRRQAARDEDLAAEQASIQQAGGRQ